MRFPKVVFFKNLSLLGRSEVKCVIKNFLLISMGAEQTYQAGSGMRTRTPIGISRILFPLFVLNVRNYLVNNLVLSCMKFQQINLIYLTLDILYIWMP